MKNHLIPRLCYQTIAYKPSKLGKTWSKSTLTESPVTTHDDLVHRSVQFPPTEWLNYNMHKAFLVLRIQTIDDLRFTHWGQGRQKGPVFVLMSEETWNRELMRNVVDSAHPLDWFILRPSDEPCLLVIKTAHFCVSHLFKISATSRIMRSNFVVGIFFFVNSRYLVFHCWVAAFTRHFSLRTLLKVATNCTFQPASQLLHEAILLLFPTYSPQRFLLGRQSILSRLRVLWEELNMISSDKFFGTTDLYHVDMCLEASLFTVNQWTFLLVCVGLMMISLST